MWENVECESSGSREGVKRVGWVEDNSNKKKKGRWSVSEVIRGIYQQNFLKGTLCCSIMVLKTSAQNLLNCLLESTWNFPFLPHASQGCKRRGKICRLAYYCHTIQEQTTRTRSHLGCGVHRWQHQAVRGGGRRRVRERWRGPRHAWQTSAEPHLSRGFRLLTQEE